MSFAATESAPESSDASFETFDNFEDIADEAEAADDDWSKPEPEQKEKVSEDLKVIKDSQADSEGKVIKEDKEETKNDEDGTEDDKEEESDKEESDKEEEEEVKEEKEEEEKPKSKLRMKMGNDLYNITSDATFKVKVDGQTLDVPVQELINNYSGKTAWDKKFTEIGKEKKSLEFERTKYIEERDMVLSEFKKILDPLSNPKANPMESLMYLVEISGGDPYNVYRRSIETNLQELENLMDMSEVERELYLHKKKDELHQSLYKKRDERSKEKEAFNQAVQKVDQLRQTYNVSQEQFVEAADELESIYTEAKLDLNEITEEVIVDYASLKPHIQKVQQLIAPYEENISEGKYGDIVAELSKYLRNGDADEASIKELLKRNYSVDDDVKELNTKVYSKSAKAPAKKALSQGTSKFESFDDWED